MNIKNFFKNAFTDMKESAQARHEIDKANFAAAKAESKASFEEAKAMSKPEARKKMMNSKHDAQLDEANKRIAAAEARIDAAKGSR